MVSAGIVDLATPDITYRRVNNVPESFELHQNHPNPFNPTTTISFNLPEASDVKLEVYNLLGQKITTIVEANLSAGRQSYTWDGSSMASGIYLYKLTVNGFVDSKIMVLMK